MSSRLRNLLIAQLVLVIGLACIFVLPKTHGIRDSAIIMSLPTFVGKWHGRKIEVSTQEVKSLAKDTDHEKKSYRRFSPSKLGEFEFINAFIVLSGNDMNNSIHRPERCLPAQGLVLESSSSVKIDIGNGRELTVTRLKSHLPLEDHRIPNLTYYWFTGASNLTNSHYMRTFLDMKDRIVTGTNQRWAYVTVAAEYGVDWIDGRANQTEEEADQMIREFIVDVFDSIHKEDKLAKLES